jgi:hypothetical protein
MKRKMLIRLVLVAGVTTMLAACTSESENGPSAKISYETVVAAQQVPVTFGTYMGETAITRAGIGGSIKDAADLAQNKDGFGVFGYYTDNSDYSASATPNFMYNQHITGDNSATPVWSYTPIKYWPNETVQNGTVDANGATTTEGADKLSFFAYAPFANSVTLSAITYTLDPATGTFKDESSNDYAEQGGAVGIIGFTSNATSGDPKVTYKIADANTVGTSVDLLWGVAGSSDVPVTTTPSAQSVTAGKPLLNQIKQKTNGRVNFALKHALAGLKLTVQGAFDQVAGGGTKGAGTTVTLESVVVTASLPDKGVLNLNNTSADTPLWESAVGATTAARTFTVSSSDLVDVLNYNLGGAGSGWNQTGVTNSAQDVIRPNAASAPQYFMFIPKGSDTEFSVTIVYHVCTVDAALVGGKSDVKNTITKSVTFNPLGGKINSINMILGLTEVKLNASVEEWQSGGASGSVDLPKNVTPAP